LTTDEDVRLTCGTGGRIVGDVVGSVVDFGAVLVGAVVVTVVGVGAGKPAQFCVRSTWLNSRSLMAESHLRPDVSRWLPRRPPRWWMLT
jgi:hypothetical protein